MRICLILTAIHSSIALLTIKVQKLGCKTKTMQAHVLIIKEEEEEGEEELKLANHNLLVRSCK